MGIIKRLDEFSFHPFISDSKGIVLLFFTGPHCASCHHLRDLLEQEPQTFIKFFGDFQAVEVKADKATALVNEFNVFHLPSLFLYKDGEFHCEFKVRRIRKRLLMQFARH